MNRDCTRRELFFYPIYLCNAMAHYLVFSTRFCTPTFITDSIPTPYLRRVVFRRSPLFAAFVRRPGGEKKGVGEKPSPDSQEPILTFWLRLSKAKPRQVLGDLCGYPLSDFAPLCPRYWREGFNYAKQTQSNPKH